MTNIEILSRLVEARMNFVGSQYWEVVESANLAFLRNDYDSCVQLLESLPNVDQLLEQLVEKLNGKRIYETIRKIVAKDLKESNILVAKGLSSLLTHVIIELEAGNLEYRCLVPVIQERLNEAIYNSVFKRGEK